MKNTINKHPIQAPQSTKNIKVMVMFILFSMFFIGTISAFEFDNSIRYEKEDMKVTLTNNNFLGLGDLIGYSKDLGTFELKSHESTAEIKKTGIGLNKPVMWYIFNFTEEYLNGMGDVYFTNMKTGKQVEKDYYFAYLGDKIVNDYIKVCSNVQNDNKTFYEKCNYIISGNHTEKGWIPLNNTNIPEGVIKIALITDMAKNSWFDAVWTIGGKRVEKHAQFSSWLKDNIVGCWTLDETSGTNVIDFSSGQLNNGTNAGVTIGSDSQTASLGKAYFFNGSGNPYKVSMFPSLSLNLTGDLSFGIVFNVSSADNGGDFGGKVNTAGYPIGFVGGTVAFFKPVPVSGGIGDAVTGLFDVDSGNDVLFIATHTEANSSIFINGTLDITQTTAAGALKNSAVWELGGASVLGAFKGYVSEVWLLNYTLNSTDAMDIWNGGVVISCAGVPLPPTVTLNSPINAFNTTNQTLDFNGSVVSLDGVVNVTLFIDGILNETNSSGINDTDYLFTKTISDGSHNWTYEACNGVGCTIATTRNFTINTAPIITVFSPINGSNSTTSTIFFNATSNKTISTWIVNYNGTNVTLSAINTTLEVEDGNNFNLLLYANNSNTGIFGLNDSVFFSVDVSSPQVTVIFPNETIDFHEVNTNLFVNWTVSDINLDTCTLEYNGINTTVTCLDNQTTINITTSSNRSLTLYVNDTLGNSNSSSVSWNYKIFQNSLNYSLTSVGGNTEDFTLNITKISSLQISTVDLVYNLSASSASFTSGDTSIISKSLGIPNPSSETNVSFFFSFTLSDSSIINTTSNNQTILNFAIGNCSTFSTLVYNFTMFDEENLTKLTNVTINYAFNLFDSTRTTPITNFSLASTANPTQICINQNLTSTSLFSLDGVLEYKSSDATGYLTRFYNILNFSLTNSSIPQNITIYSVVDTIATPFQLTFRDSRLVRAENILVNVNKQFIESNDFRTVEIPITDTNGQVILNLVRNIAIYNLIFIDIGGNIIASFNNINAFCQDATIGECTLDLDAPSTTESTFNLSQSIRISYVLSYTNSTSTASLTFNSFNSTPVTARVIGTTQNQFGNRSVCDSSLTSTLGVLNCDASSILLTDNYLFIDIFSDGNYVETRVININPSNPLGGLYGGNGYFIAFLMLLLIIILFSGDKQVLLVMLGIGWVIVLVFGLVRGTIIGSVSGGIWLLVSIITMIWKLRDEEGRI